MHITTFSDYALRVLIYLATNAEEKATAEEISRAFNISFHHAAKAAQWLARHDFVTSERGRNGGLKLARAAEEINIGKVVELIESQTYLVDCMKPNGGTCCIRPACGLTQALSAAQTAFFETLKNFTLADVTVEKTALANLLTARSLCYPGPKR